MFLLFLNLHDITFNMSWQKTYKATLAKKMYNSVPSSSNEEKVKAEDMLSASCMTGCGFSTVKTIINMTGRTTESRSTFFRHQAKSEDKIFQDTL